MDRMLVSLSSEELDTIAPIDADGGLSVDNEALARVLSRALGFVGVRVAVASADYSERQDGTPEPDTRSLSGIWWLSRGNDTSLVGGFGSDGRAMTVTVEGEGESPIAEDDSIVMRATTAIGAEYPGAEASAGGHLVVPRDGGSLPARVVVTRDHRIRRPHDVLSPAELQALNDRELGLCLVQLIGGGKALVIKHGL